MKIHVEIPKRKSRPVTRKIPTLIVDEDGNYAGPGDYKEHTYLVDTKEEFIQLYVSILPTFMKLSHPAKSVFTYILQKYRILHEFEIGCGTRTAMARELSCSQSAVANALTELKKEYLLYSHSKSMYRINPRYVFQGDKEERKQALLAVIKLGCKNC